MLDNSMFTQTALSQSHTCKIITQNRKTHNPWLDPWTHGPRVFCRFLRYSPRELALDLTSVPFPSSGISQPSWLGHPGADFMTVYVVKLKQELVALFRCDFNRVRGLYAPPEEEAIASKSCGKNIFNIVIRLLLTSKARSKATQENKSNQLS